MAIKLRLRMNLLLFGKLNRKEVANYFRLSCREENARTVLDVESLSICQNKATASVPTLMHSINRSEQRESESTPLEEKKRMV